MKVVLITVRRRSLLERLFSRRPFGRFSAEVVETTVDVSRAPRATAGAIRAAQ